MQKLKKAALFVGLVTVALWAAITLTGCGAGATPSPRDALDGWSQVRALMCGGSEGVEDQIRTYLDGAEEKDRLRRERETEGDSESNGRTEEDSVPTATSSPRTSGGSAVEPTPPTVPAPPEPADG